MPAPPSPPRSEPPTLRALSRVLTSVENVVLYIAATLGWRDGTIGFAEWSAFVLVVAGIAGLGALAGFTRIAAPRSLASLIAFWSRRE